MSTRVDCPNSSLWRCGLSLLSTRWPCARRWPTRRRRSASARTSRRSWSRSARPATARRSPRGATRSSNFTLVIEAGRVGVGRDHARQAGGERSCSTLISSTDADTRMPKEADPLSAEQIALVKRWIAEGAKYDGADPNAPLASIVPEAGPARSAGRLSPAACRSRPWPSAPTARNWPPAAITKSRSGTSSSGALVRRIKNVAERTYSLAYSPDGTLLAVAGGTPGQIGRGEAVQSGRGHAGQGTGLDVRRGLSRRLQSGRHEAGRRRRRSLDPHLTTSPAASRKS